MKILDLRRRLIDWLAGEDLCVVINSRMYDQLLSVNEMIKQDHCLFRRNKVFQLEGRIQAEVNQRLKLLEQGIHKQGRALVLDPFYKGRKLSS